MRQLRFLKDHNEYKSGETYDVVDEGYATRLVMSGVAEAHNPSATAEPAAEESECLHDEPEVETAVTRPRTKRKASRK